MMNIDFVFPKLPPTLDGIGDHTARLTEALAADGADVRVLTAQRDADPIPGVTVERAFSMERRRDVDKLLPAIQARLPDWLFIQFNQFSYGRWGLNPYLPLVVWRLQQRYPSVRIAVMFHEDFVPISSCKFAIMTLWQRVQFWGLGHSADLICFSIEPWVNLYRHWFPRTEIRHLPVGSNMPRVKMARAEARQYAGVSEETFVAGIFGSAHGSRLLDHARAAVEMLHRKTRDFVVLYVGPHGEAIRAALPGAPVIDAGRLSPDDVSYHLSAMDVHLAPFKAGVSTRRGSFMAGLQHGVPTISTRGRQTDAMLRKQEGRAYLLVEEGDRQGFAQCVERLYKDVELRRSVAHRSRSFYEAHFDWPALARTFLRAAQSVERTLDR